MDTAVPDDVAVLVPVGELVGELVFELAGEEEELLHAAAARHRASDAVTATAPFLAIGFI